MLRFCEWLKSNLHRKSKNPQEVGAYKTPVTTWSVVFTVWHPRKKVNIQTNGTWWTSKSCYKGNLRPEEKIPKGSQGWCQCREISICGVRIGRKPGEVSRLNMIELYWTHFFILHDLLCPFVGCHRLDLKHFEASWGRKCRNPFKRSLTSWYNSTSLRSLSFLHRTMKYERMASRRVTWKAAMCHTSRSCSKVLCFDEE